MLIISQNGNKYFFWRQEAPFCIFNLSLEIFEPVTGENDIQLRCNIKESAPQITLGVFKSLDKAIEVLREINNATYSDDQIVYYIPKED